MANQKKVAKATNERLTLMLDGELAKRLRFIQSKRIASEMRNISFSAVVNDMVRAGLDK